jgi:hypothetical protein
MSYVLLSSNVSRAIYDIGSTHLNFVYSLGADMEYMMIDIEIKV